MKQTAIQWLYDEIENKGKSIYEVIEQAKAMEKQEKIAFGKKCFYKGFEKAENDDANCFTAWREEALELLTFK